MSGKSMTEKAACEQVDRVLRQPVETELDLRDAPIRVAAHLLVAVIGDCEKCYFITSDGRLKWKAVTLAQCLGYDRGLAQRAVKSATPTGGNYYGQTHHAVTPRLQALRQTTLEALREQCPTPNIPCWGGKPEKVKRVFKDLLLRSHSERVLIQAVLDGRQTCPRELTLVVGSLATWSEDDRRQLKRYLV